MNYSLKNINYKKLICGRILLRFSPSGYAFRLGLTMLARIRSGQVTLEMALALVALIFFLVGTVRIGVWYNKELVEKNAPQTAGQPTFSSTRVASGSSSPGVWPLYARRPLNEDWVLKGTNFPAPGTVTPGSGGGGRGGGGTGGGTSDTCPAATALDQQADLLTNQAYTKDTDSIDKKLAADQLWMQANQYQAIADNYAWQANNAAIEANYWNSIYTTCMSSCEYSSCGSCGCCYYSDQVAYYRGEEARYRTEENRYRALENQLRAQAQVLYDQSRQLAADAEQLRADAQALHDQAIQERAICAANQGF